MLRSADRYHSWSSALADRAARRALAARRGSLATAATELARHQATAAQQAPIYTTAMLAEQGIAVSPEAVLQPLSLTTTADTFAAMVEQVADDQAFTRLVRSLVQDAGRTAQVVDATTRPHVSHVRNLTLPSCSRCAVLAGRVYRWSEGFQRHPHCDCVMIPVTVASPDMTYDLDELVKQGQIKGLSRADKRALDDGADFAKVVNVRLRKGGASQVGEVYRRGKRLTPAGVYRAAGDDREKALSLLAKNGYIA